MKVNQENGVIWLTPEKAIEEKEGPGSEERRGGAMAIELPDTRSESNEVQEALRLRAIRAYQMGCSITDIAAILGVREETVSRWCAAFKRGAWTLCQLIALVAPSGSGRILNPDQERSIQNTLDTKSPKEVGVHSALWTRAAVRDLIVLKTGVQLSIRGVGEYLARWNYTHQKPFRKSYKQDPIEVAEWLEKKYPEICRRAEAENAEIHWGDETGVRSTCQNSRGYSRPGKTPELVVSGSRFSVNMISTITNEGKLRWMIYEGKMNSERFIEFLEQLIVAASRKIFLVVDNLSVHDSQAVDTWLTSRKDKMEVFYLPKYAPERNPDEYLNCDIKGNINTDGLPKDREDLKAKLQRFMQKLASLPGRIASYFQHKFIAYAAVDVSYALS